MSSRLSEPVERPEHTTPIERLLIRLGIAISNGELSESEEWWLRSGWIPATGKYDE